MSAASASSLRFPQAIRRAPDEALRGALFWISRAHGELRRKDTLPRRRVELAAIRAHLAIDMLVTALVYPAEPEYRAR